MAQRKGKGTRIIGRKMDQYCSVCKKSFEMPVVDEADNQDVIWLKCPGCSGFLPYMSEEQKALYRSDEKAAEDEIDDIAIEDIDKEKAKEYSEAIKYDVGDIVFHRSWNDYGKVVSKETLPGHRNTIIVNFVNQGKIRLLEGARR